VGLSLHDEPGRVWEQDWRCMALAFPIRRQCDGLKAYVYRARQTPMITMTKLGRRPSPAQLLPFSLTSSLRRRRAFFS
jgi:hypothetical protein